MEHSCYHYKTSFRRNARAEVAETVVYIKQVSRAYLGFSMQPTKRPHTEWTRTAFRFLAAAGFTYAGIAHFRDPAFFKKIVPPGFPAPSTLVAVSGVAEIAGGLGLLIPTLRRPAAWGLLALLVAVFPANVFMAVAPEKIPNMHIPRWALWVRLPLQPIMMAWVWWVSKPNRR